LPYCKSCGNELKEGDKFCPVCGTPVSAPQVTEVRAERVRDVRSGEACFGPRGSGGGLWGAISGGVFLIGLGILWYFNFWWPGILFLIGIMVVVGALAAYARRW